MSTSNFIIAVLITALIIVSMVLAEVVRMNHENLERGELLRKCMETNQVAQCKIFFTPNAEIGEKWTDMI